MLNQAARHRRWRSPRIPIVFPKDGRPLQRKNASDPMGGTGVIDGFLETFTRYIDSGFGLLGNEVAFLATTLAAIDIMLAALFWAWGTDEDIIARLVKKTLFVGVFAYLIGNWNNLARIVFESFAGLGLKGNCAVVSGFSAPWADRAGRYRCRAPRSWNRSPD